MYLFSKLGFDQICGDEVDDEVTLSSTQIFVNEIMFGLLWITFKCRNGNYMTDGIENLVYDQPLHNKRLCKTIHN